MDTLHPDSLVIERLGGPVKLARRLGISNRQRVQNWKARGIPADVLLAIPWLRRMVMQARADAERVGQEMVPDVFGPAPANDGQGVADAA